MDRVETGRLYRIRVRGLLGETTLRAFPDLTAQPQKGETVLAGVLPDQEALYGVLAEIEALGLELLEVRLETRGQCELARQSGKA